jgi:hypothetical protein
VRSGKICLRSPGSQRGSAADSNSIVVHKWQRSLLYSISNFLLKFISFERMYFPETLFSGHLKLFFLSQWRPLTLSLLMSYIYGAPIKARNSTSYIHGRDFLLGILLLEPCSSLIYSRKANKYTNYSLSLLIMYGSSYVFRHYIAILRERSWCLLRDAQLRSSR